MVFIKKNYTKVQKKLINFANTNLDRFMAYLKTNK